VILADVLGWVRDNDAAVRTALGFDR
jgi:hypothetical protein